MPVYVIADITITDPGWVKPYATEVHELVHKHGGKYLTRTDKIATLEGEPMSSSLVALIEFPTERAVEAFANDPDYLTHADARRAGSISRLHLLTGEDIAGTIEYL